MLPRQSDFDVTGLTADSREVQPGWLFAALPGTRTDGRDFIDAAIAAGATVILAPRGTELPAIAQGKVNMVTVVNAPRTFAQMVARFYGPQPETAVAVTGTNGKTSTVNFCRQMWTTLGRKAASVGTLGVFGPNYARTGRNTTPDPCTLHKELADLAAMGVTRLAMEASSHGMVQYRMDGVQVKAAAFTNLTRDHLDYHGSMEEYRAAKARLFTEVMAPGGTAVLNADSAEFTALNALCRARGHTILGFGTQGREVQLTGRVPTPKGQDLELSVFGVPYKVHLPLAGGFQVQNALAAAGLLIATGEGVAATLAALEQLEGVPGRLELVATRANGAPVYVDYAHTPDALETVLEALRPHVPGKLVCLFGCGGDRDRGKRPLMGALATRHADTVIVTDDNPRSENPAAIRAEILAAVPDATEIGDRHAAIRHGVALLQPGDMLVVAGKGHETGQTVGDVVYPFCDADEARKAVEECDQ